MTRNVRPPSSLRSSALSLASTSAYTTSGLLRAMATPMRPSSPAGSPFPAASSVQPSPPSYVTYSPLPGPPLSKNHGQRRNSHMAAKSLSGLAGSMTRSATPVFSST